MPRNSSIYYLVCWVSNVFDVFIFPNHFILFLFFLPVCLPFPFSHSSLAPPWCSFIPFLLFLLSPFTLFPLIALYSSLQFNSLLSTFFFILLTALSHCTFPRWMASLSLLPLCCKLLHKFSLPIKFRAVLPILKKKFCTLLSIFEETSHRLTLSFYSTHAAPIQQSKATYSCVCAVCFSY